MSALPLMNDEGNCCAKTGQHHRNLTIYFACNDHRNGMFHDRIDGIIVHGGGWDIELDGNAKFSVNQAAKWMKIYRCRWPFLSSQGWVGSWVWNGYVIQRCFAIALIRTLCWNGWKCSGGVSRAVDWYARLPRKTHEPL